MADETLLKLCVNYALKSIVIIREKKNEKRF